MNTLMTLVSKRGLATRIGYDFTTAFSKLAEAGEVDAFIIATHDGFSPLGAARKFFADDLGHQETDIADLAYWNRHQNERVTLVGLDSRRANSHLRGVILAPCETSKSYEQFAVPVYGRPYRDFYYNVTYEAVVLASRRWKAKRLAITHLSASGHFHSHIATCNAEALAHFCDEATEPLIESFAFVGCCIQQQHLEGIKRLNAEGQITKHHAIQVRVEGRPSGVVSLHLDWTQPPERQ